MRDKVRQSTTFRYVQQRQVNYVGKEYSPPQRFPISLKRRNRRVQCVSKIARVAADGPGPAKESRKGIKGRPDVFWDLWDWDVVHRIRVPYLFHFKTL